MLAVFFMRRGVPVVALGILAEAFSSLQQGPGASPAGGQDAGPETRPQDSSGGVGRFRDLGSSWASTGSCCSSIEIITGTRLVF